MTFPLVRSTEAGERCCVNLEEDACVQVFYRTFSGETGGRVGGGGQVSACRDLPGPGRGFGGGGGGGDGVEDGGVRDVAQLVLRLQHETSGQEEDGGAGAEQTQTHLIWAAVVHPVLPVTVEAAGTSAERRNTPLFKLISNSELRLREDRVSEGEFKRSQLLMIRPLYRSKISNNPKRKTALDEANANPLRCKWIKTASRLLGDSPSVRLGC